MELLLIRHAIAFERNSKRWRDDNERPLSPRGHARACRAAAGLKRIGQRPARVLTSPLVRTRQTAMILSQCAGWPAATDCAQLAPDTPPEEFLGLLRRSAASRIAAVGHEPDLGGLLSACLHGSTSQRSFSFKKMGAALVTFHGTVRAGRGRLVWFLPPKVLRAAR